MYTATADPLGPYCTGASIPAGNVLRCARPQAQVPLTISYPINRPRLSDFRRPVSFQKSTHSPVGGALSRSKQMARYEGLRGAEAYQTLV